jgi:S-DNA-T family DNA segregation ATPase FtsK/SpoIIIE
VAGFYRRDDTSAADGETLQIQEIAPDGRRIQLIEIEAPQEPEASDKGLLRTEAQILVEKASEAAKDMGIERLKSPWPPPLPQSLPLEDLFELAKQAQWDGTTWPNQGDIFSGVPIGLLDEPSNQRQVPLRLNLERDGNLLLVGSPGSGRTTFALSLVAAHARTYPPDSIHFHLVDFGGHQLRAGFSELPHAAGTYGPDDRDRTRRLQKTLQEELERRRNIFEAAGVVGLPEYQQEANGRDQLARIVTVINGFSGFYEALADDLNQWIGLFREGRAYGIYFAMTSDRLPTGRVAELFQSRIALKLTDRTMYSMILDARPDMTAFDPVPGRGFWGSKPPVEVQLALPARGMIGNQIQDLREQSKQMDQAWLGGRPRRVKILSDHIALSEVLSEGKEAAGDEEGDLIAWIGLDDDNLMPVELDIQRVGSYFLIAGPPESGKTTALATLSLALAAAHRPDSIQIAILTPNRAERYKLDELGKLPHIYGHAKTEKTLKPLIEKLESEAETRLAKELQDGNKSAHIILMIDDYHLLAGRVGDELLARLEQLARKGADIGLTTVLTMPSTLLGTIAEPLVRQARAWKSGLWLQSTNSIESSSVGVLIPPALRGKELSPGRGFLYDPGGQLLMQVASPEIGTEGEADETGALEGWVRKISG